MSPKKFLCTRCGKDYSYKGGLSAHIKNKHPLKPVDNKKNKQAKKPNEPAQAAAKKNIEKMNNLNTQEVDSLLAEEEEFYDAIDEMEHGIGINQSMFDWANVNFNSSFGDSAEFNGMTPVVQLIKCAECETNSTTINKQMELLSKSDKQLIECQDKLKESKREVKLLEIKLEDARKALKNAQNKEEINSLNMEPTIKCRECNFVGKNQDELLEHKRNEKSKSRAKDPAYRTEAEEGPLSQEQSKCDKCNFSSQNRVLLEEHKDKSHPGFKCTRCTVVSPDMDSFRKHGQNEHGFPRYAHKFECTPCKVHFLSDDDLMNHMCQDHLTEAQREGHGLYKYESYHEKPSKEWKPLCRNGSQCYYLRQNRCNFFHRQAPQWQQGRPARQSPSSQWQQVPARRQHVQQGQGVQRPHGVQAQGHKYWSVPPQGVMSAPWCRHGRGCPMGQYCVLRHDEMDFPNLPQQGRQ